MKIKSLKISNILCFKYYEDIDSCPSITFQDGLNIFIGTNGSGKTTVLEVLNCLFTRVFFQGYQFIEESFKVEGVKKNRAIRKYDDHNTYRGLRLHSNRNSIDEASQISIKIDLDDIDRQNIENLISNKQKLLNIAQTYSQFKNLVDVIPESPSESDTHDNMPSIEPTLKNDQNKTLEIRGDAKNFRFQYLQHFEFYKLLLDLHNMLNAGDVIASLSDTLVKLGGYRNYSKFEPKISLGSQSFAKQIEGLKIGYKQNSFSATEASEPAIFGMIRLALAREHYDNVFDIGTAKALERANKLNFIIKINEKLQLINLRLEIELIAQNDWSYRLKIFETCSNTIVEDINYLSAGQKAILHLIIETYGRGLNKGGLVIIDEPELHLHYQFQQEFLSIIEDIVEDLNLQYVFVTHSESLISSKTIKSVARFALDASGEAEIYFPKIEAKDKWLVKILDNCRSVAALFCNKVLLVEGEDDRYFFRKAINYLYPETKQDIFIIDVLGKSKFDEWKSFFENLGLKVYKIADLDYAFKLYDGEQSCKLKSDTKEKAKKFIDDFRCKHPDIDSKIKKQEVDGLFILQYGALEQYLPIHNKGLAEIIEFCNKSEKIEGFCSDTNNSYSLELNIIMGKIVSNKT
jgi:predicted ATP-dependent endonuclease of OLD family